MTETELLEKGLMAFRKVLEQQVTVNKEEMVALLNLDCWLSTFIGNLKTIEGKTPEERLELARKALGLGDDNA